MTAARGAIAITQRARDDRRNRRDRRLYPKRKKQMIDITRARDGALTAITAICPNDATADQAALLFEKFGRLVKRDGLVLSTSCKRSAADDLVAALERLSYRTAPTAKATAPIPSGRGPSGKTRGLIQANQISEIMARDNPPVVNGRRMAFSGFGDEFLGGEIHGHLWGERVRYAYYVPATSE